MQGIKKFAVQQQIGKWVFLLLLVFLSTSLFAQQDITVTAGSTTVLGRGLVWGSSGQGGVNNAFLFNSISTDVGICLYFVNNNPTNGHNLTVTISGSGDNQQNGFLNQQFKWFTLTSQQWVQGTNAVNGSIPAATMGTAYAHLGGVARIAINITGSSSAGGSPDTLDAFAVQGTPSIEGCAALSTVPPVKACNQIAFQNFSASGAGNTQLVGLSGQKTIRICDWSVSLAAATTVKLVTGTGANCAAATTDLTGTYTVSTLVLEPLGEAQFSGPAATAVCVNLGAASTGTVMVVYGIY